MYHRSKGLLTRAVVEGVPHVHVPVPVPADTDTPEPIIGQVIDETGESGHTAISSNFRLDPKTVALRREIVWRGRVAGLTVREINAQIEAAGLRAVTDRTQLADMRAVYDALTERSTGALADARALELARLDMMWRAWMSQGTDVLDRDAAVILLRIIELRARLLRLDTLPIADAGASERPLAGLSDADLQLRMRDAQRMLTAGGDNAPTSGADESK